MAIHAPAALLLLLASLHAAAPGGLNQDKPEDLEKRRDEIASKLESLRGLKFKTPLGIREGTRREYAAFVLENARRFYGEDLTSAEKAFKAMGLIPQKIRLEIALSIQAGLGVKLWCA